MLCKSISNIKRKQIRCLKNIRTDQSLAIYNTEANGAIHNTLSGMKNYICSEYYGAQYKSGEMVSGVINEDLTNLSFRDETFDIVLSTDVLEHVPRPYDAHREIYRVLKKNGRHIFTVAFWQTEFLDKTRAIYDEDNKLYLMEKAEYHGDPLRPEGALVYTDFALQMLIEIAKIGFKTNMYCLYKPWYGILGPNAIVFEAIKTYK